MIEIFKLEEHPALRSPRRIMRYVLLWCSSGELTLAVDDQEFTLLENQLITITSGQYHFLRRSQSALGFTLEFSYDFFCKNDSDIELIFHNGLFCHFDRNELITLENRPEIEPLFQRLKAELEERPYQYLISTHACVELLLVAVNRAKIGRGDAIWKPNALYLRFLELVRQQFRHNLPLSHFADQLHTTEAKLNELSKLYTGKTAQMVIHGLIGSEAKRRLTYEQRSIKEVAAELGFEDPFYFSNFFKRQTGVSPKKWRQK